MRRDREAGAAGPKPRRVRSSWRLQRVADAVHGANQIGTQLAPQRLDVTVDRPALRAGRGSPDVLEQYSTRDRGARAAGKEGEQVEFDTGQVDFALLMVNSALLQVKSITTHRQRLRFTRVSSPFHPAEQHS